MTRVQLSPSRPRHGAFTLIEVLVVLGIIAILASISLVVANKVTEAGRERLTSDLIKTLDTAAQSYIGQAGKIPATYTDEKGNEFALIDARGSTGSVGSNQTSATDLAEPSLQLFMLSASKLTSVDDAVKGIDKKYIERKVVTAPCFGSSNNSPVDKNGTAIEALVIKDPWGEPIRFVHPAYHGGYGIGYQFQSDGSLAAASNRTATSELQRKLKQSTGGDRVVNFRRSARPTGSTTDGSVGDADEGLCAGTMPYFYSAGPDKDPGTVKDNVYTHKPSYPAETRPKN